MCGAYTRACVCVHLYHYCVHVSRLPLPMCGYIVNIINYTIKVTVRPTAVATLTHCPDQPFLGYGYRCLHTILYWIVVYYYLEKYLPRERKTTTVVYLQTGENYIIFICVKLDLVDR